MDRSNWAGIVRIEFNPFTFVSCLSLLKAKDRLLSTKKQTEGRFRIMNCWDRVRVRTMQVAKLPQVATGRKAKLNDTNPRKWTKSSPNLKLHDFWGPMTKVKGHIWGGPFGQGASAVVGIRQWQTHCRKQHRHQTQKPNLMPRPRWCSNPSYWQTLQQVATRCNKLTPRNKVGFRNSTGFRNSRFRSCTLDSGTTRWIQKLFREIRK